MQKLQQLVSRLKSKKVLAVMAGLFILAAVVIGLSLRNEEVVEPAERLPAVRIGNVSGLSSSGGLNLIGTVSSVSEVNLESEVSGRITSVNVTLGQQIQAGQVIGSVENSSQYASLLQAQGGYEAALAAAERSNVGVDDARVSLTSSKQSAVASVQSAYTAWSTVLYNTVDELYSSPRSSLPGVRINAGGYASNLNDNRVQHERVIVEWKRDIATLHGSMTTAQLSAAIDKAITHVDKLSETVNIFITMLARHTPDQVITASELSRLQTAFSAAAATLNTQRSSLQSAKTNLERSEEAVRVAEIGGTGGQVSSANASLKQALGSLRAAESAYAKTIFRTPIGGTVNTLSIKAGDYVSMGSLVANVANNNASLITTYVGTTDTERVYVGQKVTINDRYEGVVTAVAPGVDPVTRKIKVEINTDAAEVKNGDTVRLSLESNGEQTVSSDTPIVIPVSALKVETDRIVVYTISEEGTLVANEVTEGPLQGTHIVINSGLTHDMDIVLDARGLSEGDRVEVIE